MSKSLVIVESPAKAKTINKYLGKDFIVKSSVGHVRDLPVSGSSNGADPKERAKQAALTRKMDAKTKAKYQREKSRQALVSRMGIDPEHGWKANYQILPNKENVVKELVKLAKEVDYVYLATDLDREGEAIAWHLREVIGGDPKRYKRVVFNEITKSAIEEAFKHPGDLDISRVNAQQARRFLDRVVGFMVSPLLWAKVARGLSAGRVQSVAVKLIVEREREIRAFIPEEYWELQANTRTRKNEDLLLEVSRQAGEKFLPVKKEEIDKALKTLEKAEYKVSKRDSKPTRSKPGAPFITSTLQQAASTRLGFGVKKTMMMAQRLYEAGYITYMRTDSTNLSAEAIAQVRSYIEKEFGKKYLPASPLVYGNKEGAQEAHEAIRPSDVQVKSTQLSNMERDAERLYELIWRQFVACQMSQAEYLSTSLIVDAADFELRAKGRVLVFDGFTRVQQSVANKGSEDTVLPDVKEGEVLKLIKLDPSQHFTKPTARYTEASLVKELEARGIGRPSTYAAIIGTIQDRGYVRVEKRRFFAEKMGDIVTDRLDESFKDLMDYNFTAEMESTLDKVAAGDLKWTQVLDDFYKGFTKQLEKAGAEQGGMRHNDPTNTNIACPQCGRPMQIRTGSTGVFLGCSGYSLPPKERCKSTLNLVPGDEVIDVEDEEQAEIVEVNLLRKKHRCPKCETAMESYLIDDKRKLHICGNNPDCDGYEVEQGEFKIKGYDGPIVECDKCGRDMQLKTGRFGKYMGCTNENCKNTRKLLRNGEVAPPKVDPIGMPHLKCVKTDDHYVLRDGAAGIFLAASQFPKHRETRAPLVSELKGVKDKLDEKYLYLADAPLADPDGNPAQVRFSRKNKEQYVMSEVEGKATGWQAHYDGGKWRESSSSKAEKTSSPTKAAKKTVKKAAAKTSTAEKGASKKSATRKKK